MSSPDTPPPAAQYLRAVGELLLAALAFVAVWPFGTVGAGDAYIASLAVVLLAVLWAAHATVTRTFTFRPDPVSVGLAGIALWSAFQLVPLPESATARLSPLRAEWGRKYVPNAQEKLPAEPAAAPRPTAVPLSVNPAATRTFLADVLSALIVYAAARNWLATREALHRLAWGAAVTGILLAVLALGQFISSPRNVVYWRYPSEGQVFGPFVCRNHYPDYQNLCLGLAVGLMVLAATGRGRKDEAASKDERPYSYDDGGRFQSTLQMLTNPQTLGLTAAIGLILVSIPFSLSRGGVLASLGAAGMTWLLVRAGGSSAGRPSVVAAIAGAVLIAGWLGWGAVEQRLSTLWTGQAFDSRLPMWEDASRLIPGSWLGGTGAGTFQWAEITVRKNSSPNLLFDSAHNEYLEALIEGGVIRLAFTLLAAVGCLWVIARGYLRLKAEPVGPLLLGAWYGMAALALHSFGDFGVRIPAVALLAAAVCGYAMGISAEPVYVRQKARQKVRVRTRVRKKTRAGSDSAASRSADPVAAAAPSAASVLVAEKNGNGEDRGADGDHRDGENGRPRSRWAARGPASVALAGCVVLAAVAAALDARSRMAADRYRRQALTLARRGERAEFRVPYEEARVAARPDDTDALADLAGVRFAAASQATAELGHAVAGFGAYSVGVQSFPDPIRDQYAIDGLTAARAARAACPLNPMAHHLIGVYGGAFAAREPAVVHFERAKQLLGVDPYIWYRTGLDAYDRADLAVAWDNWRESLSRGTAYLGPIIRRAKSKLTPAEILDRLLPDDPVVLVAASAALDETDADTRRPFLQKGVARGADPNLTVPQLIAVASAATDLGDLNRAAAAWERALAAAPEDFRVREQYVAWLEQQERYAEAIPHLEWMTARSPRDGRTKDRLAAARHGVELEGILKE